MSAASDDAAIRTLVDSLFVLTDQKAWTELRRLFADGAISVDMSSLVGGAPVRITADQLVSGFATGLHIRKVSHHLATNYRISIDGSRAEVTAQGYAWNRVVGFPPGDDLWETWGTYYLTGRRIGGAWRLDGFGYFSKHTRGPDAVRAHTL